MKSSFYNDPKYVKMQSLIMVENWKKGLFDSIRKREKRICKRKECGNIFEVKPSDPKVYCSHGCSAIIANTGRTQSEQTRLKIGRAQVGTKSPLKGILKVPRVEIICAYIKCGKKFIAIKWANRKYCSNKCHMAIMGGKPTSPKA